MNNQKIDISEKTVTELKAMAYDYLAQLEGIQSNLATVNKLLESKIKSENIKPEEHPKGE